MHGHPGHAARKAVPPPEVNSDDPGPRALQWGLPGPPAITGPPYLDGVLSL